jgi:oligosaccharide repeat unit polymerase
MCFVPTIQFINDVVPWGFKKPTNIAYFLTNLFLFFANFIFFILTKKKHRNNDIHFNILFNLIRSKASNLDKIPIRLLLLTISSCIIWISLTGIPTTNQLIYRVANDDSQAVELNSTLSLLSETIRYIPFASFIMYRLNYKHLNILNLFFLLTIITLCPPTAISRFMAGTIYLTILILFLPKILKGYRLTALIAIGFLVLFPLMDELRVITREINVNNALSFNYFLSENYDTYNSLAVVIDQNIITFGYQLIGTLLFFIPRSVWQSKPIGSGGYVAELNQLSFTNISFNFYAEGFINFGYFGIILFSIILGLIIRHVESNKRILETNRYKQFNSIVYIILTPYLLFILRGDLMSSISFFFGILSALILVYFIQKNTKIIS